MRSNRRAVRTYRRVARLVFSLELIRVVVVPVQLSAAVSTSVIHLSARDRSGKPMTCAQFRTTQSNGHPERGQNDTLVDPASLIVLKMAPLSCSTSPGASVELNRPATPSSLTLAWPSVAGTSTIVLDLSRVRDRSVSAFEVVVAEQSVIDLQESRRSVGSSEAIPVAITLALRAMRTAPTPTARAVLAWRVWDLTSSETIRVLIAAGSAAQRRTATWTGVTFDTVAIPDQRWANARATTGPGGWVRVVMDRDEPASSYRPIIDRAHAEHLRVLGQLLDSSQMASMSLREWRGRVDSYLDALPDADAWEIGNEVNGNWLGPSVVEKVTYAANAVRTCCPAARTMVTVLWNLGEDTSQDSMFNWLARAAISSSNVDDIGISLYPEDHPMGTAYNRVVTTLHRAFPAQRVLISELGYGNADLGRTWWWGSRDDFAAGRTSVARLYDAASRAHPFSGGGTFWWYFLAEGDVR